MPKQPTSDPLDDDATSTTTPPQTQDNDWKLQHDKLLESYNGLKGNAQQLRERNAKLVQEREDYVTQLESLKLDLEGTQKKYQTDLQLALQKAAQAESTAKMLQRQREVNQMIRKEYPALAEFEDVLRVDDLEGDALKDYLANFASRFTGAVEKKTDSKIAGSTPPPPPPTGDKKAGSLIEIGNRLDDITKSHGFNSPEYRRVYQEYENAILAGATE